MLETFCLRLAAGLSLAALLPRAGDVEPRFFRLQMIIVLCLQATAGIVPGLLGQGESASDLFFSAVGGAMVAALIACWAWSFGEFDRWKETATAVAGLLSLLALLALHDGHPWSWLSDCSAAAILGLALTAMLLGHYYLIATTMSLRPLLDLHRGLFLATAVRAAVFAGLALQAGWSAGLDPTSWLWLALRVGAGLLGGAVLSAMAYAATKLGATQSATGILYVACVFIITGELTDQLLAAHWQGGARL